MSQFIIKGGKTLFGSVPVYGSKNAALPLLTTALLTHEECTFHNMPQISDVAHLGEIFSALGCMFKQEDTTITIKADTLQAETMPAELVGSLRGSILLLGSLLGRNKHVSLPRPGGDIIGARPIDVHLDAFTQLGAQVELIEETVTIDGRNMKAGRVVLQEFSVTATENVLLVAATLPGTTTIEIAAAEPHVVALAQCLTAMGATIEGAGTHRIVIQGVEKLQGVTFTNIPDMLDAGFFILLAAATKSPLTVKYVPLNDLLIFFKKLDDIGISYHTQITDLKQMIGDVTIKPSAMKAFSIQTLPYPGMATDLQSPFSVIATQVTGSSLIHDPMYEGRFKYIQELQKMGAKVVVCDPHRVIITGPTPLVGRQIPSLDIRSGATLLMAGLVASGTTTIDHAQIIDRGYANLLERLQAVGATIERN